MKKIFVNTDKAPKPIGPYSQAVRVGDTLYLSGQIALDPQTMQMIDGGIKEQTRKVLENLTAVLKEAGADIGSVVKTTVYLADMAQFPEMNAVYEEFFGTSKPARAAIEASALPKNALVEIDAIALF